LATLLLSDLHLPPQPSPLREAFIAFVDGPARQASGVFILGDLFEAWIGDDVGLEIYQPEIKALHRLTYAGVEVRVLRGNRDFLLDWAFEYDSGCLLLPDPSIVEIEGQRVLIAHGDRYCTDDVAYQRWRRISRNRIGQRVFTLLPRSQRMKIADRLRAKSRELGMDKADTIMDVNPAAIDQAVRQFPGIDLLVHGHTHRPAQHHLHVDGRDIVRLVLPDWRDALYGWISIEQRKDGGYTIGHHHIEVPGSPASV